jgi:CBS domain-containing protein
MKVREIMTTDVAYCLPSAKLSEAAMIMWHRDCGAVPVVDEQKRVVGMITDRDICMAVTMKNCPPSKIPVSEQISLDVKTCSAGDEAETVLKKMRKNQLRRLPVVNKDGVLLGIVSVSDLLRELKGKELKKKLFAALREISTFRPPHLREIAAETLESTNENLDENKAADSATEQPDEEQNDNPA